MNTLLLVVAKGWFIVWLLATITTVIFADNQQEYKIPRVCYQTWTHKNRDQFSAQTNALHAENKAINPDIDFQLWDDNDIDVFLKSNFPPEVYHAFTQINPAFGAAKGDFFRYCILYKRGGLYLDFEAKIKQPNLFGTIIHPSDECILDHRRIDLEKYRVPWNYPTHEQWFLAFAPGHPYLEYVIARIVRSITKKIKIPLETHTRSKEMVLRVTGPDAFTAAVHDAIVDHGYRHREIVCDEFMQHWPISGPDGNKPEYVRQRKTHYTQLHGHDSLFI